MKNIEELILVKNELPSSFADRTGLFYSENVKSTHKKSLGQYFTPKATAIFMAKLSKKAKKKNIRILDPGCGTAILAATLIEKLVNENRGIKSIELLAFEIDKDLVPYARISLENLKEWLSDKTVNFCYKLLEKDFVLHYSKIFSDIDRKQEWEGFDIIISNPPYFKLNKMDERCIATKNRMVGQANIYTLFLTTASLLLNRSGELIFIVPRSFTSGSYFKKFRSFFFSTISLKQIHVFESRKDVFARDKVLQENIIILGRKKDILDQNPTIKITSSTSSADFDENNSCEHFENELISNKSSQFFLHLPVSLLEKRIMILLNNWKWNLNSFDLKISTGPVVPFRSREFLETSHTSNKKRSPLFWMQNVNCMKIDWPSKKIQKPQHIIVNEKAKSILVANKNYILLRRFSSKDDKRRLIAAPYYAKQFKYSVIGIENHLNYIYSINKEFDELFLYGISALLNSSIYDIYFRTLNGNTNVSISELNDLPLPELKVINSIGEAILNLNKRNVSQIDLDDAIHSIIKIKI